MRALMTTLFACVYLMASPLAHAGDPTTLAILPFDNNSFTDTAQYEPLEQGLSAMLISDLTQAGPALKVIERTRIKELLKEIALGQSGAVDQATAVRAGKILGAQSIVVGSFLVMGDQVRMDARIIKTETSEVLMAASATGSSAAFLDVEKTLAAKIAKSLDSAFKPTRSGAGRLDAAVLFAKGLDAWDAGQKAQAETLFEQCIDADAAYKEQVDEVRSEK
ncbi:MAG: CsgG/HfaB family protein [Desulfovibrionaceae bacterium]